MKALSLACAAVIAAPPLRAEVTLQGCQVVWAQIEAAVQGLGGAALSGVTEAPEGGTCRFDDLLLDVAGQYSPDFRADRLTVGGGILEWLAGAAVSPDGLELRLSGLRQIPRSGYPATDWFLEAQSVPYPAFAALTLRWDAEARLMQVAPFALDLAGNNAVVLTMSVAGADDPASLLALADPMALSVTAARLEITTHGMFEAYALPIIATTLLPQEGEVETTLNALRAEVLSTIAALPDPLVSAPSRDALSRLVQEFPNPAGTLVLDLRADPGLGPARLAGPEGLRAPETLGDVGQLVTGVRLDVDWTHEDWQN